MYSGKKVESKNNKFLKINQENENLNQYWFSESTISFIIKQIEKHGTKCAFVSTPSIFYSCNSTIQDNSNLFDLDEKLIKKHNNGIIFDFNDYSNISEEYYNHFDFIIVDPPFINEASWTKYSEFIKLISIKENDKIKSKILTCSIAENNTLLKKLLDLEIKNYQPSIPHLVYQYNFFANYEDEELNKINSELM
jgi:16S rRNA G966 N2-methylase RsmD